jgi:spermidine/putrescine transport system ATP-binding protein
VLLLDEPLAALDRKLREEMQVELKRIQERVAITFIYVTHDQKEAISMSDRIAVMNEGKIMQLGTPNDIYEQPQTRFVADFMGASNIFSARVIARIGGRIQTETDSGLKVLVFKPENMRVPHLESVSICIRPEAIKVYPADASEEGDNKFRGKIEEKVYQGDFTELMISLIQGDKINVRLSGESGRRLRNILQKGAEVLVGWEPEDVSLLVG